MNPLADKWNARYADGDTAVIPAAATVLTEGARWLPVPDGTPLFALDLACGLAGNGHWLAERGFQVSAWDISDEAISQIRQRQSPQSTVVVQAQLRDVILQPPEAESFDIIVVSRFLDRALCAIIIDSLKPGGTLFYQTFTHGLSNPDYQLGPNELLSLFDRLCILEYREPEPDESGRAEAYLVARRMR